MLECHHLEEVRSRSGDSAFRLEQFQHLPAASLQPHRSHYVVVPAVVFRAIAYAHHPFSADPWKPAFKVLSEYQTAQGFLSHALHLRRPYFLANKECSSKSTNGKGGLKQRLLAEISCDELGQAQTRTGEPERGWKRGSTRSEFTNHELLAKL